MQPNGKVEIRPTKNGYEVDYFDDNDNRFFTENYDFLPLTYVEDMVEGWKNGDRSLFEPKEVWDGL